MSSLNLADLPETLRAVRTAPLFVMRLEVKPMVLVGSTPAANRRIGIVSGGVFSGERIAGDVLDGGSDWQAVQADGTTTLDVRLILRTREQDLVTMTYQGIRHAAPETRERIDRGEVVEPSSYYFRTNPRFETASVRYAWLNRILAIGVGFRRSDGVIYSVFEVL
jgi:hypothetical protein